MIQTAILGGGPAGAYCAYCLVKKDVYPVIFDHSHPREKACGGLITPLTQELFPFLNRLSIEHSIRNRISFISPNEKQICFRLKKSKKFMGFSRLELDHYLVNMAIDKGAKLINEKVIALERKSNLWKVKTRKQSYMIKMLVGADGVNSLARKKIMGPLDKRDKGLCFGYYVKGIENEEITMKFLPQGEGYIWVVPRARQTSIGIGCADISDFHGRRMELDTFIAQHYPDVEKISRYAALIPNVKKVKTFNRPLAGDNWILIGDAAGHVNPLWGEGLLYAILDGELAAQAIAENKSRLFDTLWKKAYGRSLFASIKLRRWLRKKYILELFCYCLKYLSIIEHSPFHLETNQRMKRIVEGYRTQFNPP
jgi:geranylgeranyl reductase family protein